MFGITNWKTSAAGTAALLSAIGAAFHSYSIGAPIDWTAVMGGAYMFWLSVEAKDKNVTGGTVGQSEEAKARAKSPPITSSESNEK